jgi:dihydropteroate synthase
MGVLNVTPDSFSDGGSWPTSALAVERGVILASQGADILDVGGESTRPGAEAVAAEEELRRVLPVVEGLARRVQVAISIDTTKADIARAALDAGATIVNDVSAGLLDPEMLPLVADRGATCVLMHRQGTPRDMQKAPAYTDVVAEVARFLEERAAAARARGIAAERIWVDPGIGFGKTLAHNLELLVRLREIAELGFPVCLGVSRKSFIASIETERSLPPSPPEARVGGTAAAVTLGVLGGATILRVHDVALMAQAARVAQACLRIRDRTI